MYTSVKFGRWRASSYTGCCASAQPEVLPWEYVYAGVVQGKLRRMLRAERARAPLRSPLAPPGLIRRHPHINVKIVTRGAKKNIHIWSTRKPRPTDGRCWRSWRPWPRLEREGPCAGRARAIDIGLIGNRTEQHGRRSGCCSGASRLPDYRWMSWPR